MTAERNASRSCLDHDVALVTNDRDFRHDARYGLVILKAVGDRYTRDRCDPWLTICATSSCAKC